MLYRVQFTDRIWKDFTGLREGVQVTDGIASEVGEKLAMRWAAEERVLDADTGKQITAYQPASSKSWAERRAENEAIQ